MKLKMIQLRGAVITVISYFHLGRKRTPKTFGSTFIKLGGVGNLPAVEIPPEPEGLPVAISEIFIVKRKEKKPFLSFKVFDLILIYRQVYVSKLRIKIYSRPFVVFSFFLFLFFFISFKNYEQ